MKVIKTHQIDAQTQILEVSKWTLDVKIHSKWRPYNKVSNCQRWARVQEMFSVLRARIL